MDLDDIPDDYDIDLDEEIRYESPRTINNFLVIEDDTDVECIPIHEHI